ncbi:phosphotransferase system, enzyme I, PtsI [Micrococcales bacterium KH10]|nr:phosphotransferase system, enzyme I, PtsI [Micrococcales bacterium KH10]
MEASPAPRAWHGVGVGRAGAVGPVVHVRAVPNIPADTPVLIDGLSAGRWAIRNLVSEAFTTVSTRLRQRAVRSDARVRGVLESTAALADDRALRSEVLSRISAGDPPIAAIDAVIEGFASYLAVSDQYPAARVADLTAVRHRVVAEILGLPQPGVPELVEPCVVVAHELSTTDIAALNPEHVLAIVTELGSPTSHAAIVAGQFEVPCVVQATGVTALPEGVVVAVDASTGTVTLDPTQSEREVFEARRAAALRLDDDTRPGATSDGEPVALEANVAIALDAQRLVHSAVEGVGLYRTESLFLDRAAPPSIAEQQQAYSAVVRAMAGRPVTIRTVDGGADKPLAFLDQDESDNPALGLRGFRITQTNPEVLDQQLRALAATQIETGHPLRVMAPMIATPLEAREFAARVRGLGLAQVGVMVEVPSAALRAGQILDEVDFISIGTNDLAQYAMAADRMLGEFADLLNPWQPAVLDLVAMAARAGKERGKPVGVCGESAADPVMALVLVGLGVNSLSMTSGAIPAVRFALRHHSKRNTREIAQAAMAQRGPHDAKRAAVDLVAPEVRQALGV